ncbi:MAG: MotA/TolQ/ExbB proton channel family protein [Bacteriovoracaceae bacterium]|nr:MotA/TolQ/ExbB proton channel family protein [Bacteriovoracaceae bacterium]
MENQIAPQPQQLQNTVEQKTPDQDLNFVQGFAKFMDDGGVFMWIILGIWVFGVAVAIERVKSLIKYDVDGASLMNDIKKSILTNEVQNAIQSCAGSKALLASVLKSGLKRANQSKEQIQDALEVGMLEAMPHVEKRLNYLALVANVSTLIGLLGTIYGLIQSFAAVASADAASKAELLALGISKAMNTTAFGLISAITIMVAHSLLSSRAEKIIGDMEHCSVKLVDLLSSKKGSQPNQKEAA